MRLHLPLFNRRKDEFLSGAYAIIRLKYIAYTMYNIPIPFFDSRMNSRKCHYDAIRDILPTGLQSLLYITRNVQILMIAAILNG